MNIHYDIHSLKNSQGTDEERKFVVLQQQPPIKDTEMEMQIQEACSLTSGDIRAVMAEIRSLLVRELSSGARFHLPGIGWLSLAAGLDKEANNPDHVITGKDVYLRGIQFKPEGNLFKEVAQNINFVRGKYTSRSIEYTEETMWAKLSDYLSNNNFITCKAMREEFGLNRYKALQWLDLFIEQGKLVKDGTRHMAIYLLRK